ncbi:MAG: rhomboid family intramembrane serine protease [Phycisphaerales bacterium]|nr:rhomboid family intramembrane serine protease [Phycisphaerales bacterium]
MLLLFPLSVDVPMARWPWMNWVLMAAFAYGFLASISNPDEAYCFILGIEELDAGIQEHPMSWVGHLFIHLDIWHVLGNLAFMWVFGNAVCAKIGQLGYAALWLGVGILTGIIEPVGYGASGAINGIVGFYLIMYPLNEITMLYIFMIKGGTFELSSFWVILLWLGFDVLGLVSGGESVAYLSHVSGLAIGAIAAVALLKLNVIEPVEYERTALDLLAERKKPPTAKSKIVANNASAPRGVLEPAQRLHVRLPNGQTKHLSVDEFDRHEAQGKPVNQFQVSSDGLTWTTYGQWRQQWRT